MFAPLPTPHHVQFYVFNTCMVPWSCHYKLDSEQSPNLKVDFATQSLLTLSPVPPPIYAVSLSYPLECYTIQLAVGTRDRSISGSSREGISSELLFFAE